MTLNTDGHCGLLMLEHALQYAGRGWPVFPLTGYKTPLKGSHGFLDATTDERGLRGWWSPVMGHRREHNIGLATGFHEAGGKSVNILVLDADGPGALWEIKDISRQFPGGFPRTLTAATSKGFHFYFTLPLDVRLRSSNAKRAVRGGDGIDIRADGGYVVIPPSVNAKTGFAYRWVLELPLAQAPAWLIEWCQQRMAQKKNTNPHLSRGVRWQDSPFGEQPAYLVALNKGEGYSEDLTRRALRAERRAELPDLLAALRLISADPGYEQWFKVGAAIYDYDPSEDGLAIFKAWSWSAPGYRDEVDVASCEKKWVEYSKDKGNRVLITKASIYAWAENVKKNETLDSLNSKSGSIPGSAGDGTVKEANGHHSFQTAFVQDGVQAEPITAAMLTPIHWPDTDEKGRPRPTTTNAAVAIRGLAVTCSYDVFHDKMTVGGYPVGQWAGDLSDEVVLMLRRIIKGEWKFDPGERNMRDAAMQECLQNSYDPVLSYLDGLRWDGVPRVGNWVCGYLGAAETPLNREVGRLWLLAAVRRARQPGCKFDQIIVVEGKEGTGKSTAIKILAGEENFSDQHILGASDREQQEASRGVWLHEIAELTGMKRTEGEKIKQFASRTEDRARPAYGRFRKDYKRRGIYIATTNDSSYLKSETGNRRFWPIESAWVDLVKLRQDRDQLWAEAVILEKNADVVLPKELWADAARMQHSRLEHDAWEESVSRFFTMRTQSRYNGSKISGAAFTDDPECSVYEVLTSAPLQIPDEHITQINQNRVARALVKLGYEKFRKREGDHLLWKYRLKSGN